MDELEQQVTHFLQDWSQSGNEALVRLFPLVFADLRQLAQGQFRRERGNHTLQPTALVNECYLRLMDQEPVACVDRSHFLALATRVMRRILVDHARHRNREKRPGQAQQLEIEPDELQLTTTDGFVDIVALDEALERLWQIDADQARIAELRFFAGFTFAEIGEIMGINERTAKRKWEVAKLWLHRTLSR